MIAITKSLKVIYVPMVLSIKLNRPQSETKSIKHYTSHHLSAHNFIQYTTNTKSCNSYTQTIEYFGCPINTTLQMVLPSKSSRVQGRTPARRDNCRIHKL